MRQATNFPTFLKWTVYNYQHREAMLPRSRIIPGTLGHLLGGTEEGAGCRRGPTRTTRSDDFSKEVTVHILWWIVVGLIAGWLTGKIMKGTGYGVIGDIVLGVVGAMIGGFIMRQLGFVGQGGMIYTILVAVGGAVVLTALVRGLKRL